MINMASFKDLPCLIHLENVVDESIKLFSNKTWKTLRDSVEMWCKLDGKERELAESVSQAVKLDCDNIPTNIGYHHTCYSRFIDKRSIRRAEIRCARRQTVIEETGMHPPAAKLLRSQSGLPIRSSSNPVLPAICIICKTAARFIT